MFAPDEFSDIDNSSVEGDLNERARGDPGLYVDDVDSDADDPEEIYAMVASEW